MKEFVAISANSPFLSSIRLLICIFLFFGLGILYIQRTNLSSAIICMVNHNATSIDKFNWDKIQQNYALSAFFYGYTLTQIPGGIVAYKIGGKLTCGLSILLGSILTLLLPLAARTSLNALLACRFLIGFFHGFCFPGVTSFFKNWITPNEKSKMMAIAFSGIQIGVIFFLPLSSYLCVHGFDGGWASIFYISGLAGLVWSIIFLFAFAEQPEFQKLISKAELFYIQSVNENSSSTPATSLSLTPWRAILTSKVVLTLCFCLMFCNMGHYFYITQLPTYMNETLKFDVKTNGLTSSLPYLSSFVTMTISSIFADLLIKHNIFSTLNVRKIFTGFASLTPIVCLLSLSFLEHMHGSIEYIYFVIFLLTLGYTFNGCIPTGGFTVTIYEISGEYASIIMGLVNTFGNVSGFIVPFIVGYLTTNYGKNGWKILFWIISFFYGLTFILFCLFGDVKLQSWANKEIKKNDKT